MALTAGRLTTAALKALSSVAEPLSNAGPARPACVVCGLWGGCASPGMLPFVQKGYTGQLLVVGETPRKDEEARSLLRQLLRDAGVPDQGVSFVPVVRCQPPKNGIPTMKQIRCCRPFLLTVIDTLAPRAILGMGGSALRAFTNDGGQSNVTRARGRPIPVSRLPRGGASGVLGDSRAPFKGLPGGDSPVLAGSLIIPPLRSTPEEPICLCISKRTSDVPKVQWFRLSPREAEGLRTNGPDLRLH